MSRLPCPTRRRFLVRASHLTAAAAALPVIATPARAAARGERRLAMVHTHTGERISIAYAVGERYLPDSLDALDHFLRDHYTGEVGRIEPRLFDLLHRLQTGFGDAARPYEVISGYRCPTTNERLRRSGGGGVARRSLHMEGRAVDVRLAGVGLADFREAALAMGAGGVGFYPREGFVHVDTGRVRRW